MKKNLKYHYDAEVIKRQTPKPLEIIREYLDDEIVKNKYNGNDMAAIIAHVGRFEFDKY